MGMSNTHIFQKIQKKKTLPIKSYALFQQISDSIFHFTDQHSFMILAVKLIRLQPSKILFENELPIHKLPIQLQTLPGRLVAIYVEITSIITLPRLRFFPPSFARK